MNVERRVSPRTQTAVAVEIDGQVRKHRVGVSRDTSATGMLVATPSKFDVGEELTLTVYIDAKDRRSVRGRVTRVEINSPESDEPWRYRLALVFDAPAPELQERCARAHAA